ncbi:MAG: hypothetical protein M3O62_01845 [Pseudomonadota bacterium]|nr:hypothetical protein [Pseudomonadota bacterium]
MSASSTEYPFRKGVRYRVKRSFTALRDIFEEGEEMTYDSTAWSRYDGITGYFFSQPGRDRLRMWDIHDDESVEIWKDLFEPID